LFSLVSSWALRGALSLMWVVCLWFVVAGLFLRLTAVGIVYEWELFAVCLDCVVGVDCFHSALVVVFLVLGFDC